MNVTRKLKMVNTGLFLMLVMVCFDFASSYRHYGHYGYQQPYMVHKHRKQEKMNIVEKPMHNGGGMIETKRAMKETESMHTPDVYKPDGSKNYRQTMKEKISFTKDVSISYGDTSSKIKPHRNGMTNYQKMYSPQHNKPTWNRKTHYANSPQKSSVYGQGQNGRHLGYQSRNYVIPVHGHPQSYPHQGDTRLSNRNKSHFKQSSPMSAYSRMASMPGSRKRHRNGPQTKKDNSNKKMYPGMPMESRERPSLMQYPGQKPQRYMPQRYPPRYGHQQRNPPHRPRYQSQYQQKHYKPLTEQPKQQMISQYHKKQYAPLTNQPKQPQEHSSKPAKQMKDKVRNSRKEYHVVEEVKVVPMQKAPRYPGMAQNNGKNKEFKIVKTKVMMEDKNGKKKVMVMTDDKPEKRTSVIKKIVDTMPLMDEDMDMKPKRREMKMLIREKKRELVKKLMDTMTKGMELPKSNKPEVSKTDPKMVSKQLTSQEVQTARPKNQQKKAGNTELETDLCKSMENGNYADPGMSDKPACSYIRCSQERTFMFRCPPGMWNGPRPAHNTMTKYQQYGVDFCNLRTDTDCSFD